MARRDLTFRVFVSSTFSDLKAERNALQQDAFPRLREYCRQRGARFQAIDLRWGVSQEAALDQQTMRICSAELARCQELSPKPNFIVLLGQRYGWRPLPETIPADGFEAIRSRLISKDAMGHRILDAWYRRDDNAVPPEFVLQPRTGRFEDFAVWESEVERPLLKALDTATAQLLSDPAISPPLREALASLPIGLSATHQEILHGAFQTSEAEKHVFAYFREIEDAPGNDPEEAVFIDHEADRIAVDQLKTRLKQKLPDNHVFPYKARWQDVKRRNQDDSPTLNLGQESDLKQLCDRVYEDLKTVIDEELASFKQRPGLDREQEAHCRFGEERCAHFKGRADILSRIQAYLDSPDDTKPLVIHGTSGCGKTALMAQAALHLAPATRNLTPVVRFIGATPESADLRSLLRSLCAELGIAEIPQDMNELVRVFRQRLSGTNETGKNEEPAIQAAPVIVFLDALDQLNDADNAKMLYWLPRELAPGVQLVLSILETEPTAQNDPATNSAFSHDPFDLSKRIWPDALVSISAMSRQNGDDLLEAWLSHAGRTLQPEQKTDLLDKFERDGRPLYLKLAFEESRLWHSWSGLPQGADGVSGLAGDVQGILLNMLQRLEQPRNHGRALVEHALGNLAAAKNGLTEEELLDVLSAESSVMEWFYNQSPTERAKDPEDRIKRLPRVIWSRLHAALKPYMAERRADGTNVMSFYHRQVAEAVMRRYLPVEDTRFAAHQRLAEYFHGLDYWAESIEAQRARARRLPPTPRPANVRKVVELPYHRLEAAKLKGKDDAKSPLWDAVADLLTDWQFLEAKAEADPNFDVDADRKQADQSDRIGKEARK